MMDARSMAMTSLMMFAATAAIAQSRAQRAAVPGGSYPAEVALSNDETDDLPLDGHHDVGRRLLSEEVATALPQATFPTGAGVGAKAAADPARPSRASASAAASYADPSHWLCLPGRSDACAADLTTTLVQANGTTTIERFRPASNPPIDCFYVYPTVSIQPGPNSTLVPTANEIGIVQHQAERFRSQCRLFAPMYRQVTATFALGPSKPSVEARNAASELAYADVVAAWHYYLAHENRGRGVVLIGHSQGSGMLTRLITEEIDGRPIQRQIVSALLMGTDIAVPEGKDVGGTFKSMPMCRRAGQTGCVIAFASFRDNVPPDENAKFGRPRSPIGEARSGRLISACVNPAALDGGTGELKSYLGNRTPVAGFPPEPTEWAKGVEVNTPFVAVPGLLSAHCVTTPTRTYLAIHVNADPADPRTDQIRGDFDLGGHVDPRWGLHIIDANLTIGNLIDIVHQQSEAWRGDRSGSAALTSKR